MAFIKKLALGSIFISILCIFGMSYNANATSTTINLNNFTLVRSIQSANQNCTINNGYGTVSSGTTYCESQVDNSTLQLLRIETDTAYEVKKGDILTFYLFMTSRTSSFEGFPYPTVFNSVSGGWDVIGYEYVLKEDYDKDYIAGGNINQQGVNYDLNFDIYTGMSFYRIYEITLRARADGNLYFGLNGGSAALWSVSTLDYAQKIRWSIRGFSLYRFSGDEANKEVEEKTQEAVDESQSAGSSSSSSASQGGANLLSAITGFFNVITSAQPTNCRFNAPLNTYFGNERLNVDLCALDLPSGIGALTSIIAIGILIPFAIHMFNKFIALFRSFQS